MSTSKPAPVTPKIQEPRYHESLKRQLHDCESRLATQNDKLTKAALILAELINEACTNQTSVLQTEVPQSDIFEKPFNEWTNNDRLVVAKLMMA